MIVRDYEKSCFATEIENEREKDRAKKRIEKRMTKKISLQCREYALYVIERMQRKKLAEKNEILSKRSHERIVERSKSA